MYNSVRSVRLPSSAGIMPVSSFPERYSSFRSVRPPNSDGISPLNSFSERRSSVRSVRLPNSGGTSPLSSFPVRSSNSKSRSVAQLRRYLSTQVPRAKLRQIGKSPNSGLPVNSFSERCSDSRSVRPPSSDGISPLNSFSERCSNSVRPPSSDGSLPQLVSVEPQLRSQPGGIAAFGQVG